jgi:hypothetical protein
MEFSIEKALIFFRKCGYNYLAIMTDYNEPMNYISNMDYFTAVYYANRHTFMEINNLKLDSDKIYTDTEDNCFIMDHSGSDYIYSKNGPGKVIILFSKTEPEDMQELDNAFKYIKAEISGNLVPVT